MSEFSPAGENERHIALRCALEAFEATQKALHSDQPLNPVQDIGTFEALAEHDQFTEKSRPKYALVVAKDGQLDLAEDWLPFYLGATGYEVQFMGGFYSQEDAELCQELTGQNFGSQQAEVLAVHADATGQAQFYDLIHYHSPDTPTDDLPVAITDLSEKRGWLKPGGRLIIPSTPALAPLAKAALFKTSNTHGGYSLKAIPTAQTDLSRPGHANLGLYLAPEGPPYTYCIDAIDE